MPVLRAARDGHIGKYSVAASNNCRELSANFFAAWLASVAVRPEYYVIQLEWGLAQGLGVRCARSRVLRSHMLVLDTPRRPKSTLGTTKPRVEAKQRHEPRQPWKRQGARSLAARPFQHASRV